MNEIPTRTQDEREADAVQMRTAYQAAVRKAREDLKRARNKPRQK